MSMVWYLTLTLLAVSPAIIEGCPPSDRAALLAFKAALQEPYLGVFNTWTGTDCCHNWYGVSCDQETRRVANITLRGESEDPILDWGHYSGNMTGYISRSICSLTRLSSIIIVDWKAISGEIPTCITSLPFLRILDLFGNKISGEIPHDIGRLQRLTVLNFADNLIYGRIPASLFSSGIGNLNLSRNALDGYIPDVFGPRSHFTVLDLSYNNLRGAIPKSMSSASYIGNMDLSHNHLCGRIPAGSPFDHLEASSFAYNDCLCGKPMKAC